MTRFSLALLLVLTACGGPELVEPNPDVLGEDSSQELGSGAFELNAGEVRLRLMAANITSGTNQSYTPGEGTRIFQGTDPDIVMIQEFNYGGNTAAELRSFVDTAFGTSYQYYREGGAQIPNGIISRYPILASGEWDDPRVTNRDFAWARIDIPGTVDLWAISVHLLTASATERDLEAQSLKGFINQNVPAGAYVAIGGDFNTSSRTEAALSTLSSVVVTAGPYPADRNGNTFTNASRAKPYDWVLVSSGLDARETATVIGASSFTDGTVIDTRVYSPLAEISPALATDSGATNMQHMAVIRDFGVPSSSPTASVTVTAPNGGESWTAGSAQSISWTSSNVSSVKLEYTLDGSAWTVITDSTAASAGSYAWTVPSTASTSARVRVTDTASGTSDTSNAAFTIVTGGGGGGGAGVVFLNEVLANEPGSDVTSEFVEIVNGTTAAVSLAGWTVSDGAALRHTFASGTSLAAGAAIAVFGGTTGIPAGLTNGVAASTGTLGLSNSGDSVTLKNAAGATVDTVTLASSLTTTDGVSANRNPDAAVEGTWSLHTAVSTLQRSPGKRANGTDFVGGSTGGGGGTGGTTAITAESESNDAATSADGPVGNNVNVSGAISSSTDVDWFKLVVGASGTITVKVTMPGTADLDWYLYRDGATTSYLTRGYTSSNPEVGSYAASPGTYYVKVVGYGGATSAYTLNVSGATGVISP